MHKTWWKMCCFQAKARSSDKEKAMPASEPRWQFSKNPGVQSSKSGDHADAAGGLDGPRCQEPRCQVPRCQEPRCQMSRCPGARCQMPRCQETMQAGLREPIAGCNILLFDDWQLEERPSSLPSPYQLSGWGSRLPRAINCVNCFVDFLFLLITFDFHDVGRNLFRPAFGSHHITDNHHNSKLVKMPWSQWQIMMRMCTWANLGNSNGLISSRYLFSLSPTLKMHSLKMSQERKGSHL